MRRRYPCHVQETTVQLKFGDGHEEVVRVEIVERYDKLHHLVNRALKTGRASIGNGAIMIKIFDRREVAPGSREAMF